MTGLYISFPFCEQKCTYCNFASGVFSAGLRQPYLEAVRAELHARREHAPFDTVYLGGGTPSLLDGDELVGLLKPLGQTTWLEATLEAAPGSITAAKAGGWASAGINRVSLGVQSFVEREARSTGRRHTPETVASDLQTLGKAGITNVNIDLIAGLAHQTPESWENSLDWIERLAPSHVSIYILEVDEKSRLGTELQTGGTRYGAGDTPTDDATAAMYERAVERLAGLGIKRYEISNFAQPGFESAHNLKYWTMQPYIGCGADAHSFDGPSRWANPASPVEFIAQVGDGTEPTKHPVSAEQRIEETLFTGLRLRRGVRIPASAASRFAASIEQFEQAGLAERPEPDLLRLTPRGVLLSNEVFQAFLAP